MSGNYDHCETESMMYTVKIIGDACDDCNLKCDECETCAHSYTCSCVENSIKCNMCKHIHVLHLICNRNDLNKVHLDHQTKNLETPSINDLTNVRLENGTNNLETSSINDVSGVISDNIDNSEQAVVFR